jgi:3-oxoadipate enol-lactonase
MGLVPQRKLMPLLKIPTRSITLNYLDQGSGPVLMLVHGFPLSHQMWQTVVPQLAKHWRVIVPDLRGFGDSPWPDETQSTNVSLNQIPRITITDYARDLSELLLALGINQPIVLCGLSMGGYIALQFALNHADQLRGLVLCNTRAAADSPEVAANRERIAAQVLAEGNATLTESMLPRLFASTMFQQQPDVIAATQTVMLGTDRRAVAQAQLAMAQRPDVTMDLQRIAVPELSIAGEHDPISTAAEMAAWTAEFPHGRFVRLSDAGHMTPVEQPSEWFAAVQAWAEEQRLI